jgi:acetate kinase
VDEAKNTSPDRGERDISSAQSRVRVLIIPTNEELVIATDTMRIVKEKQK